jgi:hypothetical protein
VDFSRIWTEVDGHRTYKSAKADLINYLLKLNVGGWVVFHDFEFQKQFPGLYKLQGEIMCSSSFSPMQFAERLG